MPRPFLLDRHLAWCTLAALALLLGWDASGLDLPLARAMGGAQGFALRDHWLLSGVLHDGMRGAAWLLGLWLTAGVWWPTLGLRQLGRRQRVQWALATWLALLLISLLKHASRTSCPWDLSEFGGRASHVSHWAWGMLDGGGGHCFPAGHASAGFAFMAGYFAWRERSARQARCWLAGALAAGLLLGVVQQLRGAHYMSHTLWTAWLCWTTAWTVDLIARRRGPAARPQVPEIAVGPPP